MQNTILNHEASLPQHALEVKIKEPKCLGSSFMSGLVKGRQSTAPNRSFPVISLIKWGMSSNAS